MVYPERSRSLRGSVDWNYGIRPTVCGCYCRSLRGSVDWNIDMVCTLFRLSASLPSRERGLKLHYLRIRDLRFGSLPSRERGLKSPIIRLYFFCGIVAPFAGAWIEITHSPNGHITMPCRSLRGSVDWNCSFRSNHQLLHLSLPSRERGLKWFLFTSCCLAQIVAPFAGAWIEIHSQGQERHIYTSLPSRERGLKC